MIYIVWQTQHWETPYFIAAFATKQEAERCVAKIKSEATGMVDYSIRKGYINFEIGEVTVFDRVEDAVPALLENHLIKKEETV